MGIPRVHEVTNSGLTTEVKGRPGKETRARERAANREEKRRPIDEKIERDRGMRERKRITSEREREGRRSSERASRKVADKEPGRNETAR